MRKLFSKFALAAGVSLAYVGFFTSCAPQVKTSIKLKPDLSDDDTEIWQIDARGGAYTSYEEVKEAMKKTAAEKSETEGYDCFFLYSDSYNTEHYSYTTTKTKTMYGQANSYGSTDYQSNNSGYLGSSRENANANYSYQVPVTETHNYSKPTAVWYVFFKKEEECEKHKNSKWRENIYYNKNYLKREPNNINTKKKPKEVGKKNSRYESNGKLLTDSRDGKKYKTVRIGTQTWMAENLNYNASGSKCNNNNPANYEEYGRLYNWEMAMKSCPKGWHLPSDDEWNTLMKFVNPSCADNSDCAGAGTKLKSATGWKSSDVPAGTDEYGFSALPGGFGTGGNFGHVGNGNIWWSASECSNSDCAYNRGMGYGIEYVLYHYAKKFFLFSVRCLKD